MVVFKSSPQFAWSLLEFMIGAGLKKAITLQPFGEDRAISYCNSVEEKSLILKQGKLIGGALIDKVENWNLAHHRERNFTCLN
ncbi:hypothetical protein Scep_026202 [Stephania cephalantha]|uniref:Uncharacterized protein n=1 Tax=Stephania cephalantha TaxID=152367 RepID=A0AAP0ERX5_9MAGN